MAVGGGRYFRGLAIACAVAAVILDLKDVAGRAFGISPESLLGHRGISHSIAAAAVIATIGSALLAACYQWRISFPCLFLSVLSHGLTDMLTDGGKGIALMWPVSGERLFAPVRPTKFRRSCSGVSNGKLPLVLVSGADLVDRARDLAGHCLFAAGAHTILTSGQGPILTPSAKTATHRRLLLY